MKERSPEVVLHISVSARDWASSASPLVVLMRSALALQELRLMSPLAVETLMAAALPRRVMSPLAAESCAFRQLSYSRTSASQLPVRMTRVSRGRSTSTFPLPVPMSMLPRQPAGTRRTPRQNSVFE